MTVTSETLKSGTHARAIEFERLQRNYQLFVPRQRPPRDTWPVVLALHSFDSNPQSMLELSGLSDKAEAEGFLVVLPEAAETDDNRKCWSDGHSYGRSEDEEVDDVGFVSAVLDDLREFVSVDPLRIYATGIDSGATMCYRLANELSDRIAAIAPVGGAMGSLECSPKRPVSICHFHGTDDQYVPYRGGSGRQHPTRTNFFSVEHTILTWVTVNRCVSTPRVESLPVNSDDGSRVTRSSYTGGKRGVEVVLYTIEGGGHAWPGQQGQRDDALGVPRTLSAVDAMWELFQRHCRH